MAAARVGAQITKDASGWSRLKGGKWGFIDKVGKWAVSPQFDGVGDFKDRLAGVVEIANKNGRITDFKWGFINTDGEMVVNPPSLSCPLGDYFQGGLLGIKTGGKFVENGMEGGKCGFIDKTGAWAINPQFEEITGFQEEVAGAKSADKWGVIDRTGKWIVNPQFDKVEEFKDGLARTNIGGVSKKYERIIGGKWGFIDKTGKWVVNPQFDEVREFKDGLAAANIGETVDEREFLVGGKWGFIDRTGKWFINPNFDKVSDFKDPLAGVTTGGELRTYKHKNKTCKTLVGEKWGIIDKNGQWVVNPIFEYYEPNIISGVIRGGAEGHVVFNASGELIWQEHTENKTSKEGPAEDLQGMMGSGFYVSDDGHVITNYHVVYGAKEIKIAGQRAELISQDASNDLALLKLPNPSSAYAIFRKANSLKLGEDIFAYGFPFSGLLSSSGSLSSGTISALSGIANNVSQIQISVPVQPGNSGGPLLDRQGAVVGVVVGKLDERAINKLTGHLPENVNFAINAANVKAFLMPIILPMKNQGFLILINPTKRLLQQHRKLP